MRERGCTAYLDPRAKGDLGRLNAQDEAKVLQAVLQLEGDPLAGKPLKGSMRPARRIAFGLSGGWYRAAYVFLPDLGECVVFLIGPRGGFYELAERRFRALKRRLGLP